MPEVFPPLATFPLSREARFTTRLNQMADLTEYRAAERAVPLFRWDLTLGPVTDAEVSTVRDFFQARGGGYESFCFFDPLDNLLQWSEDFSQAAWQKSSPADMQITSGVADPMGGMAAQTLSNTGTASNIVKQTIPMNPVGITFTGSFWMKAATAPVSNWKRFLVTGTQAGLEIEIPAGASVDLFGAQLVAAAGPANYTRTTTVSGFHSNCRFESAAFDHRVLAPNVNQLRLAISEF